MAFDDRLFWIVILGTVGAILLCNLPQSQAGRRHSSDQANRVPPENRDGQLSRAQIWALAGRLLGMAGLLLPLPLVLPQLWTEPAPFVWLLVLFAAAGLSICGLSFIRTAIDLIAGRASSCEGMATTSVRHGRTETYLCNIQGHTFIVPRSVYNVITNGDWYRIYYTPYSKTLLAIEPGQ